MFGIGYCRIQFSMVGSMLYGMNRILQDAIWTRRELWDAVEILWATVPG